MFRFVFLICMGFSSRPVPSWNRRLNSSWASCCAFSANSALVNCRSSFRSMSRLDLKFSAGHTFGCDRELVRRQTERFMRNVGRNAIHLIEDSARLDHRHPVFWISLALSHAGLRRLLGNRLIRKDSCPYLPAAFHEAGDRDTGGFDLSACYPTRL